MASYLDQNPDNPEFVARAISCTNCAWRHDGGVTCDAFPSAIPLPILFGVFDHRIPYSDDEVSDGGLTFTSLFDL